MKIITTVGTSLVINSGVDCASLGQTIFSESIFDGKKDSNLKKSIDAKQDELRKFIQNGNVCAELASLNKIDPKGAAEIHLLCTETVLSYLCGRVLQQYLGDRATVKVVKGLQVQSLDRFKKEGVPNLLSAIEAAAQNGHYYDDVVLNVTGGYKAIIPIMSIIGQIKRLPTYYIFKGDDDQKYELIEMPRMPVDFQTEIFERFLTDFERFGNNSDEILEKHSLSEAFLNECGGCLEMGGEIVMLNSVGKILLWNYRQQFFQFHSPETIWKEMQAQTRLMDYCKQSFSSTELRNSQNVAEDSHKTVMKKFSDTLRIYWFQENGEIYVYKTFENHDAHEKYIRAVPFNEAFKAEIIHSSKLNRLKIQR